MSDDKVVHLRTGDSRRHEPPEWQVLKARIKGLVDEARDLTDNIRAKRRIYRIAQFELRGPIARIRQQCLDYEGSLDAVLSRGAPETVVSELRGAIRFLVTVLGELLVDLPQSHPDAKL
jgi:hypothetical protein